MANRTANRTENLQRATNSHTTATTTQLLELLERTTPKHRPSLLLVFTLPVQSPAPFLRTLNLTIQQHVARPPPLMLLFLLLLSSTAPGSSRLLWTPPGSSRLPSTPIASVSPTCCRFRPRGNASQGQMLAALLGWPQATFASKLEVVAASGRAIVTREVDGGLQTLVVALPAVVTADLRLNTPRFVSLPNALKAKKKPIEVLTPEQLGVDVAPQLQTLEVNAPPLRKAGARVADVAELIDRLRNEAKGYFVDRLRNEAKSSDARAATLLRLDARAPGQRLRLPLPMALQARPWLSGHFAAGPLSLQGDPATLALRCRRMRGDMELCTAGQQDLSDWVTQQRVARAQWHVQTRSRQLLICKCMILPDVPEHDATHSFGCWHAQQQPHLSLHDRTQWRALVTVPCQLLDPLCHATLNTDIPFIGPLPVTMTLTLTLTTSEDILGTHIPRAGSYLKNVDIQAQLPAPRMLCGIEATSDSCTACGALEG
eukprot:356698-Chlamydomonas_euryale.AAC.7